MEAAHSKNYLRTTGLRHLAEFGYIHPEDWAGSGRMSFCNDSRSFVRKTLTPCIRPDIGLQRFLTENDSGMSIEQSLTIFRDLPAGLPIKSCLD